MLRLQFAQAAVLLRRCSSSVPVPRLSPAARGHYDFKSLRSRVEYVQRNAKLRNVNVNVQEVVNAHVDAVAAQANFESLRRERNALSQQAGLAPVERAAAGRLLKQRASEAEALLTTLRGRCEALAARLPCDSHPASPIGAESAAREIALHGSPRAFSFAPRDHVALGRSLQLFDLQAGADIAGSGFVVLKNDGVLLEHALVAWALSRAAAAGFTLVSPPDVARGWLVEGCGFNPREAPPAPAPAAAAATAAAGAAAGTAAGGGGNVAAAEARDRDRLDTVASASAAAAPPAAGASAAPAPAPLFPSQVYGLRDSDLCLVGTAEIPLAGLHADSIVQLPPPRAAWPVPALRYCAVSHCFRREAGAHGQRDRGLYRLHQFTKVELFAFVAPDAAPAAAPAAAVAAAADPSSSSSADAAALAATLAAIDAHLLAPTADAIAAAAAAAATGTAATGTAAAPPAGPAAGGGGPQPPSPASEAAFARLVRLQAALYAELGLHYRVLDMPTQELGAAAYRKVDIEAWMPCRAAAAAAAVSGYGSAAPAAGAGTGAYGEISSASNCVDYQARRLNIRYRPGGGGGETRFVHTLNATACAVPRVMLALLETHQREDGTVAIPAALQPFMGGRTVLAPPP